MKTINAPVAPGRYNSMELAGRRAYRRMDTAGIKRHERRNQRHALRAQLQADIFVGMSEGTIHPRATIVEKVAQELPYNVFPLFAVPAVSSAAQGPSREVKIIRRTSAFRKPTVEILRLAA